MKEPLHSFLNPHMCTSSSLGETLDLEPRISEALQAQGISTFFPVQKEVLPFLYKGLQERARGNEFLPETGDVVVSAPTGEGKTLCYVLPLLNFLFRDYVHAGLTALIIVPTKELVIQVSKVLSAFEHLPVPSYEHPFFGEYPGRTRVNHTCLVGQASIHQERQALETAEIVIATPGRLQDHLGTPVFRNLRVLILDEYDRFLQDFSFPQFFQCLRQVEGQIRIPKWLFSATLSTNSRQLAKLNLSRPQMFSSGRRPAQLYHGMVFVKDVADRATRLCLVVHRLLVSDIESWGALDRHPQIRLQQLPRCPRILVFVSSKEGTHRLARLLQLFFSRDSADIQVAEVSGDICPADRAETLARFERGETQVLVSSDLLARGVDLPNVDCVIHYQPPSNRRTYVHRSGRTARRQTRGLALTLLEHDEKEAFTEMLNQSHLKIINQTGHLENPEACLEKLEACLTSEANSKFSLSQPVKWTDF